MKVKLKATLVNGKETHAFGSVVDLKKDEAQRLIGRDLAEEVTAEVPTDASARQEAEAKAKAEAEAKAKEEAEAKARAAAEAKALEEAEAERARTQQPPGQQTLG